ncbi:MAG: YdbH domain-containing protein [Magnetococcales bacterium]|nr:YdbH domain-containing protein [Magnetococcales bacterium]
MLTLLALSLFGLLHYRNPLLRQGVLYGLSSAGFPQAQVHSIQLETNRLSIKGVTLGPGIRWDSLVIQWPWQWPRLGYLSTIELENLMIEGDLLPQGFVFKGEEPTPNTPPSQGGESDSPSAPLSAALLEQYWPGELSCRGCRAVVGLEGQRYPLALDVTLARHEETKEEVGATSSSSLSHLKGEIVASVSNPDQNPLSASLLSIRLQAQVQDFLRNPAMTLHVEGGGNLAHGSVKQALSTLPFWHDSQGELAVKARVEGRLPVWSKEGALEVGAGLLARGEGKGALSWSIADLSIPSQQISQWQSQGGLDGVWQGGEVGITLDRPLMAAVNKKALLPYLPPPLGINFKERLSFTLEPGAKPLSLRFNPANQGVRGSGGVALKLKSGTSAALFMTLQTEENRNDPTTPGPLDLKLSLANWRWESYLLSSLKLDSWIDKEGGNRWRVRSRVVGSVPTIQAEGWQMDGVQLQGVVEMAWQDGRLVVKLVKPLDVGVDRLMGPPLAQPIRQGRLSLKTTQTPLAVWSGESDPANQIHLQLASSQWSIALKQAEGEPLRLRVTAPSVVLSGNEHRLSWLLEGGQLSLPSLFWQLDGVGSRGVLIPGKKVGEGETLQGQLTVEKISSLHKPSWIRPLTLSSRFRQTAKKNHYFTLDLTEKKSQALTLNLRGAYSLNRKEGRLAVDLQPITLGQGGVTLQQISPALAAKVEKMAGTLVLSVKGDWNQQGVRDGEARVALEQISAHYGSIQVEGLSSKIRLFGPTLSESEAGQSVTIRQITAGIPIKNSTLLFQLLPEKELQLQQLTLSLLNALISADPSVWSLTPPEGETVVRLSGLDLAKVAELIHVPGLTLIGQLSGQLPFSVQKKGLVIQNGLLKTDGGGIIRLAGENIQDMAKQSGIPPLVIRALKNYHYQTLSLRIDRDSEGETLVVLQAVGSNPELEGGRAVELNLNLSGKLDQIASRILFLKEKMDGLNNIFSQPTEPDP